MGAPAHVAGAIDRVRVAIMGLRGRGEDHIHGFGSLSNVEIAALCDIDDNVMAQRLHQVQKVGFQPETYSDVRKLLENKTIDAVSIATPHHWHALIAIWAMQAGKDVYVEKPCSFNPLLAATLNNLCVHRFDNLGVRGLHLNYPKI